MMCSYALVSAAILAAAPAFGDGMDGISFMTGAHELE
jgi:hypothetical protein